MLYTIKGFPDRSVGKESACNAGDPGLIRGSGRSTGEGTGYPLQYSWASLWLSRKESTCSVGDLDSISELGRSPGEWKGYPLQCSKSIYSGLGVQNKAGQRLTEFCQENALVIANTLLQ